VLRICCLCHAIHSHRFPSIQLVEAFFEGRLIEMMHQTLEGLLLIPR